ncbi:MAG: hypothetical protein GY750_00795 [Lentisphaerae bacterium]|nr:hypothetical protein [Lentisphaerota bacterium]MCP4099957.1 hypothetical protein [Lentisphaerota bacterium]
MKTNYFYALTTVILAIFYSATTSKGGSITEKDGKTIITIEVDYHANTVSKRPWAQAEIITVQKFIKKFPQIFARKYAAKYKTNPQKYGNYNWDNVELKIEKAHSTLSTLPVQLRLQPLKEKSQMSFTFTLGILTTSSKKIFSTRLMNI